MPPEAQPTFWPQFPQRHLKGFSNSSWGREVKDERPEGQSVDWPAPNPAGGWGAAPPPSCPGPAHRPHPRRAARP